MATLGTVASATMADSALISESKSRIRSRGCHTCTCSLRDLQGRLHRKSNSSEVMRIHRRECFLGFLCLRLRGHRLRQRSNSFEATRKRHRVCRRCYSYYYY